MAFGMSFRSAAIALIVVAACLLLPRASARRLQRPEVFQPITGAADGYLRTLAFRAADGDPQLSAVSRAAVVDRTSSVAPRAPFVSAPDASFGAAPVVDQVISARDFVRSPLPSVSQNPVGSPLSPTARCPLPLPPFPSPLPVASLARAPAPRVSNRQSSIAPAPVATPRATATTVPRAFRLSLDATPDGRGRLVLGWSVLVREAGAERGRRRPREGETEERWEADAALEGLPGDPDSGAPCAPIPPHLPRPPASFLPLPAPCVEVQPFPTRFAAVPASPPPPSLRCGAYGLFTDPADPSRTVAVARVPLPALDPGWAVRYRVPPGAPPPWGELGRRRRGREGASPASEVVAPEAASATADGALARPPSEANAGAPLPSFPPPARATRAMRSATAPAERWRVALAPPGEGRLRLVLYGDAGLYNSPGLLQVARIVQRGIWSAVGGAAGGPDRDPCVDPLPRADLASRPPTSPWTSRDSAPPRADQPSRAPACLVDPFPVAAVVHLGDVAYDLASSGGRRAHAFLARISRIAAHAPYLPLVGNHDVVARPAPPRTGNARSPSAAEAELGGARETERPGRESHATLAAELPCRGPYAAHILGLFNLPRVDDAAPFGAASGVPGADRAAGEAAGMLDADRALGSAPGALGADCSTGLDDPRRLARRGRCGNRFAGRAVSTAPNSTAWTLSLGGDAVRIGAIDTELLFWPDLVDDDSRYGRDLTSVAAFLGRGTSAVAVDKGVPGVADAASPPQAAIPDPWRLLLGHRPPYATGAGAGEAQAVREGRPAACVRNLPRTCRVRPDAGLPSAPLEPALRAGRVDLCAWGHVHSYERTWPIVDGKRAQRRPPSPGENDPCGSGGARENGTVCLSGAPLHVVTGAGGNSEMKRGAAGVPPAQPGPCPPGAPDWCAWQSPRRPLARGEGADHSFSVLDVFNATHARWTQVSVTLGEVVDAFWIVRRGGDAASVQDA